MSVIINGINLPTSCENCIECNKYYHLCNVTNDDIEDYWDQETRPENCPLIPTDLTEDEKTILAMLLKMGRTITMTSPLQINTDSKGNWKWFNENDIFNLGEKLGIDVNYND